MVMTTPALSKTVLPNGLRVVTEPLPYCRSVAIGVWIGAGSRWEMAGERGVSHFLEHLMFKGTISRSARRLAEEIDQIGGHMNAYTTKEYTCYHARVLDEHLHQALELLADMLLRSRLDPDDINKEKGVVFEEFKLYEDMPDEVAHDLLARCLWPDHPLGHSVLGSRSEVASLDSERVRNYLRRLYSPANAVLTAVGRVDHARMVELASEFFGDWSGGPIKPVPIPPTPGSTRRLRLKDTEQVHLCLGTESYSLGDPDLYAMMILANILGGGPSSRLFQSVREDRGLAYSIYAFQDAFFDSGVFGLYAGTSPETAVEVLDLIFAECEKMRNEPVAESEFLRTKEQLKTNMVLSLENASTRMMRIGRNELLLGRAVSIDEVVGWLDQVDPAKLQVLAETFLDPEKMAIAAVSPVASVLPQLQFDLEKR